MSRRSEHDLDLALAAELQAALLPERCPTDCNHQVAAARNRMCVGIGGDFYDFLRLEPDQYALLIGDVIGHGVRAALIMAQIMGFLRSAPHRRRRPSEVVRQLNELLIDLGERTGTVMPCSLFYSVIDVPTGIIFYVNAGHPDPLLCNRKACSTLNLGPRNMVLGVQPFEPEEGCVTFRRGQRLVLYTDGITESPDANGGHFGAEGLVEVLEAHLERDPEACADAIFSAVDGFGDARQHDDQTVVVIDRISEPVD